ncbi:MAG: hypothetical protein ACKOZW_03795, partial [Cyanobium sp.]
QTGETIALSVSILTTIFVLSLAAYAYYRPGNPGERIEGQENIIEEQENLRRLFEENRRRAAGRHLVDDNIQEELEDIPEQDDEDILSIDQGAMEFAELDEQKQEEKQHLELADNPAITTEVNATQSDIKQLLAIKKSPKDASQSLGEIQSNINSNQAAIVRENQALNRTSSQQVQKQNQQFQEEQDAEEDISSEEVASQNRDSSDESGGNSPNSSSDSLF